MNIRETFFELYGFFLLRQEVRGLKPSHSLFTQCTTTKELKNISEMDKSVWFFIVIIILFARNAMLPMLLLRSIFIVVWHEGRWWKNLEWFTRSVTVKLIHLIRQIIIVICLYNVFIYANLSEYWWNLTRRTRCRVVDYSEEIKYLHSGTNFIPPSQFSFFSTHGSLMIH